MAASSWLIVAIVFSPLCVTGYVPHKFYMDEYCGNKTVMLSKDATLEFSQYNSHFPADYSCKMAFQSTNNAWRIQVRVLFLDTRQESQCSSGGIILSDGNTYLTPSYGICGTREPKTNYRTASSRVTVELTNTGKTRYGDFELLVTAFYKPPNGTCSGNSNFKCDNGICISSSLTCNSYNDCGDDSDEMEGCAVIAAGIIVGIVFGIIGFLVILSFLGFFVRRRRYRYTVTTTVREYPSGETTVTRNYTPSYATGGYQSL